LARRSAKPSISSFDLEPGTLLAEKYVVLDRLGKGWEGEVYRVRESSTGIVRSAKLFFPQRNRGNRAVRFYAMKLHKLRDCRILIQYHTQERLDFDGAEVAMLVSDYVEGEILTNFLKRQPGRRLDPFQGLHLLHTLAAGMEAIHDRGEYHGDLHDENVIVRRRGMGFEVKLLDMFHWGRPSAANIRADVVDLVRLLYDVLGGARRYGSHPPEIKAVVKGLRPTLIHQQYVTAGQLREFLENLEWESR